MWCDQCRQFEWNSGTAINEVNAPRRKRVEEKMERAEADVEWQNGDQGTPNILIDSSGAEESKYSWHPKPPLINYLSAMQVSITIRYVRAVSSATGRPFMTVKCWKNKFKKKSKQHLAPTYPSTSSRGEHKAAYLFRAQKLLNDLLFMALQKI